MACLQCQKQFNQHSKEELEFCIDWIQTHLSKIATGYSVLTQLWSYITARGKCLT